MAPFYKDLSLFDHKLVERLTIARKEFIRAKYGSRKIDGEHIDSAKQLYLEFLETLVSGKLKLELPERYTHQCLWEMLIQADFDWKDEKTLDSYINWFQEKRNQI